MIPNRLIKVTTQRGTDITAADHETSETFLFCFGQSKSFVVVVVAPGAYSRLFYGTWKPLSPNYGGGSGGGGGSWGSSGKSVANEGSLTRYSTTVMGLFQRSTRLRFVGTASH